MLSGPWRRGRATRPGQRATAIKRDILGPGPSDLGADLTQRLKHMLGQGAVSGELAAIKGDEAAGAVGDRGQSRAAG